MKGRTRNLFHEGGCPPAGACLSNPWHALFQALPAKLATAAVLASTVLAALGRPAGEPPPVSLRLVGDRVTLRADHAPLSAVLDLFRAWDVEVAFRPETDPRLSIRMDDVDAEAALAAILKGHDYLLVWRVIPGPLGPLPKLRAIRVVGDGVAAEGDGVAAESQSFVVAYPGIDDAYVVRDEILLRVKPGVSVGEFKRLLDQVHGGVLDGNALVGVYRVRLRPYTNVPALVEQLRRHQFVDRVEPHWVWRRPGRVPADVRGAALSGRRVDFAAGNDAGKVAVLDTGISGDAPWGERLERVIDLTAPGGRGDDTDGHGTWMAGLAGGFVDPLGAAPVAGTGGHPPLVTAIKVFGDNGVASLFDILNGVEQAIDAGAGVMSLSWGAPQNSRFLEESLAIARHGGLIVMAASGNTPTTEPVYPAALPSVLAVGALESGGRPWGESNRGAFVVLAAPGFAAIEGGGDAGGVIAGTSVATAYAAGVLARFRATRPDRDADEALAMFLEALSPSDAGAGDPWPLAGRLDDAALSRLFGETSP